MSHKLNSHGFENFFPAARAPKALVVLLHGYGDCGKGFAPCGRHLQALSHSCDLAVWVPSGLEPHAYAPGRQWFALEDIRWNEPDTLDVLLPRLERATQNLLERVEALQTQYGLSTLPLFLGGFSQGAAMATYIGLYVRALRGILNFSGFLPEPLPRPLHLSPLYWYHGEEDGVVLAELAQHSTKALKLLGVEVTTVFDPGVSHTMTELGLKGAAAFIHGHVA